MFVFVWNFKITTFVLSDITCVIKLLFSKTVTNMTFYNEIKKSCLKIINENLLYEKMNKNLYEKINKIYSEKYNRKT